jgi:hypothetical protein
MWILHCTLLTSTYTTSAENEPTSTFTQLPKEDCTERIDSSNSYQPDRQRHDRKHFAVRVGNPLQGSKSG